MTAEAVAGQWDGSALATAFIAPQKDALQYLSAERRGIVLFAELSRNITVQTKGADTAILQLGTSTLAEIKRPSNAFFKDQLNWVRAYADLRMDRVSEINQQIGDLLSFFGASTLLNANGRQATLELLALTQNFAIMLEMSAKHFCWSPRPGMLAPQVMPIIQTPDHSSFPSGHAMEAFAIATVLDRLMSGGDSGKATPGLATKALHFRIAQRVATNRTIAGVHYPVDSAAGAVLGVALGDAIWSMAHPADIRAPVTQAFEPGTGAAWFGDAKGTDFTLDGLAGHFASATASTTVAGPNPLLKAHWGRAAKEWSQVTL